MNRDDIIRMAREANRYASNQTGDSYEWHFIRDERFAALVAAAERDKYEAKFKQLEAIMQEREQQPNKPCCLAAREACAKLAEAEGSSPYATKHAAANIRARGNT